MNEKERIEGVFDNWYYDGLSVTNMKTSISTDIYAVHFCEYLKWNHILNALNISHKVDLPNYKILDSGCGNGNAIRKMIEFGAKPSNCYGMDISEKVLEFAKENSPSSVHYSRGFIDHIEHEPEYFDIIFSLGVFIHILDNDYIRKVADEFHRVLKKDGIVIVLVTDSSGLWNDAIMHTTRNFDFDKKELQGLFSQFECLGVVSTYADRYSEGTTAVKVLAAMENNNYSSPNKLVLFRKK